MRFGIKPHKLWVGICCRRIGNGRVSYLNWGKDYAPVLISSIKKLCQFLPCTAHLNGWRGMNEVRFYISVWASALEMQLYQSIKPDDFILITRLWHCMFGKENTILSWRMMGLMQIAFWNSFLRVSFFFFFIFKDKNKEFSVPGRYEEKTPIVEV